MTEAIRPGSRRRLVVIVGGILLVAAAGIAIWFAVRDDSSTPVVITAPPPPAAAPGTLSHRQFALLYERAIVHTTRIDVLRKWPRTPYQRFRSGDNQCYEWFDRPIALYTLCFKDGVLADKAIT